MPHHLVYTILWDIYNIKIDFHYPELELFLWSIEFKKGMPRSTELQLYLFYKVIVICSGFVPSDKNSPGLSNQALIICPFF